MKRILLIITTVIIFLQIIPAEASYKIKIGNSCNKRNLTSIIDGNQLICLPKGKKLIWQKNRGALIESSSTSARFYPPSNKLYIKMQELINKTKFEGVKSANPIIMEWEPSIGDNGDYSYRLNNAIDITLKILHVNQMDIGTQPIYYEVGRTQIWFKNYLISKCNDPGPENLNRFSASEQFNCGKPLVRGVLTNVASVASRKNFAELPALDLSKVVMSKATEVDFATQAPHELFHAYQNEQPIRRSLKQGYIPLWLQEGSATMFGLMVASLMKANSLYADTKNDQMANMPTNIRDICSTSITNMVETVGSGCQYFQGAIAAEVLVANHGGWAVLKRITENLTGRGFEIDFKDAVGVSLSDFYSEVDSISKELGYARNA